MPVNTLKQAQIILSNKQMEKIGELAATAGGREGARIEETNLANTIAVITIPGKRIHLVTWNGESSIIGQESR